MGPALRHSGYTVLDLYEKRGGETGPRRIGGTKQDARLEILHLRKALELQDDRWGD
jgi:hypothetical protein